MGRVDDNLGVTGYEVYRDGAVIATIAPATTYSDTGVLPGDHGYEVLAFDAADNISDPSNTANINVPDIEPPTAPGNLTATAVGSTRIDLAWQASNDNVAVTAYDIYRDTLLYTSVGPTATSYSDSVLAPAVHTYVVRALDAAALESDPSNSATATVLPPDILSAGGPRQPAGEPQRRGHASTSAGTPRSTTAGSPRTASIATAPRSPTSAPVTSYSDTNLAHRSTTPTA